MLRFFLSFVLAFLLGCEDNKTIVIGTSADYPPYMFYKDGQVVGYEKDVIDTIAKELNLKLVLKDLPFDSLIAGLQSKRLDGVIAAMNPTDERRQQVDFSVPYHNDTSVLLVLKTSDFNKIEDLKESHFGVQLGSVHEVKTRELNEKKYNITVKALSKMPELVQELKTKRIQAIVLGIAEANFIKKAYPAEFKLISLEGENASLAIAFPKDSKLLSRMNAVLEKLSKAGTLKAMYEKWSS